MWWRRISPPSTSRWHISEEVTVPDRASATFHRLPMIADEAPDFVKRVEGVMLAGKGDLLPVSAFPVDGTWPLGTAKWEKRTIAEEVPLWDMNVCIQCNKCAMVCPHSAIRAKVYEPAALHRAPSTFLSTEYRAADFKGWKYTIQVAPTGLHRLQPVRHGLSGQGQEQSQAKAINMEPLAPVLDAERPTTTCS